MPKISNRGNLVPASPIRKLVPFAEAAAKKGIKIYHLNIGQPDIETPEEFWNAVKKFQTKTKVLSYTHSAGNETYRRKLSEYYKKNNINVEFSDILVTTGGSEAISFGLFACLDEGDEVIIPEPFYTNYNSFAVTIGVKIKAITASIDDGFALPPISEFEKLITPKTKAIMICNPNNPTGYLYSEKELKDLKDLVLKYDLYLFADEVYREFVYEGKKHKSILEFEDINENAVVFDSISKRYSACGARIGAIVSRNKELMKVALHMGQGRLCSPNLDQAGAEAAVDVGDEYFDKVIKEYISRRDLVVESLNKMEGVVCPNPGGAFYTVAKLPIDDGEKFCQWMLEKFEYKKQTVMMAPAQGFYASQGKGINQVRIAYVLKKEDLINAMQTLEKGLEEYQKTMMK